MSFFSLSGAQKDTNRRRISRCVRWRPRDGCIFNRSGDMARFRCRGGRCGARLKGGRWRHHFVDAEGEKMSQRDAAHSIERKKSCLGEFSGLKRPDFEVTVATFQFSRVACSWHDCGARGDMGGMSIMKIAKFSSTNNSA